MWIAAIKIRKEPEILHLEDGYFTVEASFLVPIVCFLIFGIMLISLYLWDLNFAKSFLNRRVTELSKDENSYGEAARSDDLIQLRDRLFLADVSGYSISKSETKVKGSVELSMDLSVPLVGEWLGKMWSNSFHLTIDVGNNAEQMRRWDQIE